MPRPTKSSSSNGGARKHMRGGGLAHGRTNCGECKVELRKGEGETCDSCRLSKLGWKKVDTSIAAATPMYHKNT